MAITDPGWELYRSFLAVLDEGSLSAAARELALTQPTIGRHVAALEEALGAALFTRSPQGLIATEAALELRPYAQAMAANARALLRTASGRVGEARGTVRVTASEVIGAEVLPPILTELREANPALVIELVLSNRNEDLLRRDADIAIRMVRPTQGALLAQRIGEVPLGLHAHERYLERHGTPGSLDELSGHSLIGFDRETAAIRVLRERGVAVHRGLFALRADSDLAQLAAIRAGFGDRDLPDRARPSRPRSRSCAAFGPRSRPRDLRGDARGSALEPALPHRLRRPGRGARELCGDDLAAAHRPRRPPLEGGRPDEIGRGAPEAWRSGGACRRRRFLPIEPEGTARAKGRVVLLGGEDRMDRRWTILLTLFLARSAMGFQFQSVASVGPLLSQSLAINFTEIGLLIGLYFLPGAVISLPGGLFIQRFGDERICAAGLCLMAIGGLLLGASDSFAMAFAGRLISGTGAILFNQVLTKMATDWFAGREIVLAMAVVLASWPFGVAAGLILQPWIAQNFGWPAVMQAAASLCALALLLVLLAYRKPSAGRPAEESAPQAGARSLTLPPREQILPVAIAGVIWAMANLGLVLFFSFAPHLLQQLGYSAVASASWPSTALWITMVSVPLGGYLIERDRRPDGAIVLFTGATAAILALLAEGVSPPLLCAAFGAVMGFPAGAIMALPARLLEPANRAAGLGIFFTSFYALMTLGPTFAGWLEDRWHSAAAPILFAAALFLAITPLAPVIQAPDRGEPSRRRRAAPVIRGAARQPSPAENDEDADRSPVPRQCL